MVIMARNRYKKEWKALSHKKDEEKLEDYRNFFADTGIEAETHGVAREYFENADQQLGILPPERHIELNNFITMVKNRSS